MRPRRTTGSATVAWLAVAAIVGLLALSTPAGAAGPVPALPRSLGVVVDAASTSGCPSGYTCRSLTVICPGVIQPGRATVATGAPSGTRRGVVVLFTGDTGSALWTDSRDGASFLTRLRGAGFQVAQVRWENPWMQASPGESVGSAALACRPASVIDWVYRTQFVPMHLLPGRPGECGFCAAGNSAGGSEIAYALSHYGLDVELSGIFPSGGPPHAALAKGCLRTRGQERYWIGAGGAALIDSSYGYVTPGPCASHTASFANRWRQDSIELQGSDYAYPRTRVHVMDGALDPLESHSQDYANVMRAAGTPVTVEIIAGMGHGLSAPGLNRLYTLITARL